MAAREVYHCAKIVQIRSFFWSVFSRIRAEYGNLRSLFTERTFCHKVVRVLKTQKFMRFWSKENLVEKQKII